MKTNVGSWRLPLLLLACLSLTALQAVGAQLLYDTGTPQFKSDGTGTPLANPNEFAAGSFQCTFPDCDIEGFTFWTFNGVTGGPTGLSQIDWQFDPVVFNFKGPNFGTATVLQIGDCMGPEGFQYCLDSINLGKSIDVQRGTYWFWLTNAKVGNGYDPNVYWADAHVPNQHSDSYLDMNGHIAPYTDPKSFQVYGVPTPEPNSLLLLGSGLLGVVAYARRRFIG